MYEDMTFEMILSQALAKVPEGIDKREGSLIYTALAPACAELAQMYIQLDVVLNETFADTASREFLIKRAAERGIDPKDATKAIVKGVFNLDVGVGKRFSLGDFRYTTTERILPGVYKMECEMVGSSPNGSTGRLLPIDYVNGLTSAELTEIIEPGDDEEALEDLRNRYFVHVKQPATSGNANQYKQWALQVSGVGGVNVYPLWNGAGTVKVVIVDNDKRPVPETLIIKTAEYIDEVRPIGANVTVVSAVAKEITISATVYLASGYSLQTVIDNFTALMEAYFKEISFTVQYISHAKIGTILLTTEGIIDYSNMKINGLDSNIPLSDEEVPVLRTAVLEV